ncbi:SusC/RagA family TonB-linked outer membrane protein [Mariniflexile sp. HNIBRBA6329]|uniref:SusC/RagA family TonB-linked outer membrane protein n=1 Tax=Mariniflexile sp. HNIBRBA6329 TaxID=3373088 RepID=UPI003746A486
MKKYVFIFLFILPLAITAQKVINGTITDGSSLLLPGASILEKGTTNGQITDFDGKFTITVRSTPTTLVVSYIGYASQELVITNQNNLTIVLKENQTQLDEVVVIGYGAVEKRDVTGSISSIKPTVTAAQQAKGIETLIQGRAAGVQVSANGAEPGATNAIKIRGAGSLTGSTEPIYVIDGIIVDSATEDVGSSTSTTGSYLSPQNAISAINPNDIEDIQILKDASATAIYGSRGANGVVIITTKKGQQGKAKFNFTTQTSVGRVTRNTEVLNTLEYANYQNDMRAALGASSNALPYVINSNGSVSYNDTQLTPVEGINWADDTYRTSLVTKHRMSISGGSDTGNYYISGAFTSNQGTFPRAKAEQIDFNINLNQDLSKRLKLNIKTSGSIIDLVASRGTDGFGGSNHSMVRQVILAAPIVNFADNNQSDDVDTVIDGPRAWVLDFDDLSKENRILGKFNFDYKLSDVFTYRLLFGADYRTKLRTTWFGNSILRGAQSNGEASRYTLDRFRYNIDNTLMFKKRFNKNHRIDGTVGYLIDKLKIQTTSTTGSGFFNHVLRADGIEFAENVTPLDLDSQYPTIYSFIGRMNYVLMNRYLFTATFRADGSSRFAKGNRWGYFPAASFAWKAIEEPFMKKQNLFSDLKFRLGYGQVGNQSISSYQFLQPYDKTNAFLSLGSANNLIAVTPANLANTDLKWEAQEQYNAGIDFGLFNDRFTATVDVYEKTSNDLLIDIPLGPSAGFRSFFANQGTLINRGIEFAVSTDVIQSKDFTWSLFGNVSVNRNKITKLGLDPTNQGALGNVVAFLGRQVSGGNDFKQAANIFVEGKEIGLFYGFQTNGIIRTADELITAGIDGIIGTADDGNLKYGGVDLAVGDVRYVDQNGDGNIDNEDRTIIGNPNPDFTYGFGTTIAYKNFSLSLLFNGTQGNDIANGNLMETAYADNSTKNVSRDAYLDAFDPVSNPNGNYPRVGTGGFGIDYASEFSDRIVEDGSFLRLSYINLAYNIPVDRIKGIDNAQITLSGQNLLLFTKYSGFDPEVNSFANDPLRLGIDWGSFPNQKTVSVGLNVTF